MDSDLMRPPGPRCHANQTTPSNIPPARDKCVTILDGPMGCCLALLTRRAQTGHSLSVRLMAAYWTINFTVLASHASVHQREILFLHGAALELFHQTTHG